MGKIEVDVVRAQPLQASLAPAHDIWRRQVARLAHRFPRSADLCADDGLPPLAQFFEGLPQKLFTKAPSIALGGVKQVDAQVQRGLHNGQDAFPIHDRIRRPFLCECRIRPGHGSDSNDRDVEIRSAEFSVFHGNSMVAGAVIAA